MLNENKIPQLNASYFRFISYFRNHLLALNMFLKDNSSYYQGAIDFKSAQSLIKYVSIDIWNRIGFVHSFSKENAFMNIYEVTLTQNMAYEIIKFYQKNKINLIGLYESKDEKRNGSDILVCIEFTSGYLKFPFQAKILTTDREGKDGIYECFWHKNKIGKQTDLINKYASKLESYMAFYLTYNFTVGNKTILTDEKEEYYGCSYISTNLIEQNFKYGEKVTFNNLHAIKHAKPFHNFFDDGGSKLSKSPIQPLGPDLKFDDVLTFFSSHGKNLSDSELASLKFYTKEEIFSDETNWTNLSTEDSNYVLSHIEHDDEEFNPQFKLVLMSTPSIENSMKSKKIPEETKSDIITKSVNMEPAY